jgi:antitoxin component YwqK of YwqJK toxin-antitoxin module
VGFRLGNIIILGRAEGPSVVRERHGAWRFVGPDGRTWATGTFERGVPVGTWRTFWGHGRINKVIEVVDGLPHGPYLEHDKDGNVILRGQHDRGHQVGRWIRRHPDGSPAEDGEYVHGHRHGLWTSWHDTHHLKAKTHYHHGTILSLQQWNEWGEPLEDPPPS